MRFPVLLAALLAANSASALELKPFKDELFAYPATIASEGASPTWTGVEADTFKYGSSSGITPTFVGLFPPDIETGNGGRFSFTALSNIDNDATQDNWSIASVSRTGAAASDQYANCAGGSNPAGEPCNDKNDVND